MFNWFKTKILSNFKLLEENN